MEGCGRGNRVETSERDKIVLVEKKRWEKLVSVLRCGLWSL
jgi:hypothetical protein